MADHESPTTQSTTPSKTTVQPKSVLGEPALPFAPLPGQELLQLQRSIGNQAVLRLLRQGGLSDTPPSRPGNSTLIQLRRENKAVVGITHLVKMVGKTIYNEDQDFLDNEGREVEEGDIVEIDTSVRIRSRRGANQEIEENRARDLKGPHQHRWFKALSVNSESVGEGFFIREGTFMDAPAIKEEKKEKEKVEEKRETPFDEFIRAATPDLDTLLNQRKSLVESRGRMIEEDLAWANSFVKKVFIAFPLVPVSLVMAGYYDWRMANDDSREYETHIGIRDAYTKLNSDLEGLRGEYQQILSGDPSAKEQALGALVERVKTAVTEAQQKVDAVHARIVRHRASDVLEEEYLFDTKAGTQKSSKQAKRVVEGAMDDRLVRLIALLKKNSNNDKIFGATMQWIAGGGDELKTGYQKVTGKGLEDDITKVFKAKSLQTVYLIELLNSPNAEPSKEARLALKLGILGQTWFGTGEGGDALEYAESAFSGEELAAVLAGKGTSPFAKPISENFSKGVFGRKHKHLFKQLSAMSDLKHSRENKITDNDLDTLLGDMVLERKGVDEVRSITKGSILAGKDPVGVAEFWYQNKLRPAARKVAKQFEVNQEYAEKIVEQWYARKKAKTERGKERQQELETRKDQMSAKETAELLHKYDKEDQTTAKMFTDKSGTYMSPDDKYLCEIYRRLEKWHGGIDNQALIDAVIEWSRKAAPEVRAAVVAPDSRYLFRQLLDASVAKTGRGLSKGALAYLLDMIKPKEKPKKGEQDTQAFDQVMALTKRQGHKNAFNRWKQNDKMAAQFTDILFGSDGLKDPQLALIQKFGDRQKWEDAEDDEAKFALFTDAFNKFQAHLTAAGLSDKQVTKIMEQFQYRKAAGKLYQKLRSLAKGRYRVGFGKDVLELVTQLEPGSPQMGMVRADRGLLELLRTRTLGRSPDEVDKNRWKDIVTLVGLPKDDPLRDPVVVEVGFFETRRGVAKDKYQAGNKQLKGQLFDQEKVTSLKESTSELDKQPDYWAARISAEYQKGVFSNEIHRVLETIYLAQHTGVTITDSDDKHKGVAETLKAMDLDAYNWMVAGRWYQRSRNGNKLVKKIITSGKGKGENKLTLQELLKDSRKDVTFKSQVDKGEIDFTVDNLSPEQILREWFDFDGIKQKVKEKRELQGKIGRIKKDDPEGAKNRIEWQRQIAAIDKELRVIDIRQDLLKLLDNALSPAKALEVKKAVRFKLGEALASQDPKNEEAQKAQTLLKYIGSTNDEGELPGEKDRGAEDFSGVGVNLMGLRTKAISNVETQKQSQTAGTQWSSLSSRMLQRDEASAMLLGKLWSLEKELAGIDHEALKGDEESVREAREAKRKTLVKQLQETDGEYIEIQKRWKETKDKYDARVQQIISIIISSLIFTISMASGVGAAAGIIQLCWAVASTLLSRAIQEGLKRYMEGDSFEMDEAVIRTIAATAGSITGVFGAELAWALDVSAMDAIHQGSMAAKVFGKPAVGMAKAQINTLFSSIGEKGVEHFAKQKHPFARLAPEVADGLKNWVVGTITSAPEKYMRGVLYTAFRLHANEIGKDSIGKLGLGLGYAPATSAASWTKTDAEGNAVPFESRDVNVFPSTKNGIIGANSFEQWFNSMGQFESSPGAKIGRTAWNSDGEKHDNALDMFRIFGKAYEGLTDPKVREAVIRGLVWESDNGFDVKTGFNKGLTGIKGKLLNEEQLSTQKPEDLGGDSEGPSHGPKGSKKKPPKKQAPLGTDIMLPGLIKAYRDDMADMGRQDRGKAWGTEEEVRAIALRQRVRFRICSQDPSTKQYGFSPVFGTEGPEHYLYFTGSRDHYGYLTQAPDNSQGPDIIKVGTRWYTKHPVPASGHCIFQAMFRAMNNGNIDTPDDIQQLRAQASADVPQERVIVQLATIGINRDWAGVGPRLTGLIEKIGMGRLAEMAFSQMQDSSWDDVQEEDRGSGGSREVLPEERGPERREGVEQEIRSIVNDMVSQVVESQAPKSKKKEEEIPPPKKGATPEEARLQLVQMLKGMGEDVDEGTPKEQLMLLLSKRM